MGGPRRDADQTLGMGPGKAARIETDNADVEPAEVEAQMRRMVQLASEEALRKGVTSFHDADDFQASTLGIGDRANREADHDHRNTQPDLRASGPARPVGLRRRSLCAAPP